MRPKRSLAMTARNVEARIIKLETRRQRPNEILLVWRWPDADVKAAVSVAKFVAGDRVICVEWFGDGPLPGPKWYRERLSSQLGAVENGYLDRSLDRMSGDRTRDPGFAEIPPLLGKQACEIPDNDLLHMVFGVAT